MFTEGLSSENGDERIVEIIVVRYYSIQPTDPWAGHSVSPGCRLLGWDLESVHRHLVTIIIESPQFLL